MAGVGGVHGNGCRLRQFGLVTRQGVVDLLRLPAGLGHGAGPRLGCQGERVSALAGAGALRVQPSEFAKVGLVLVLAAYLSNNQREIRSHLRGFLIPSCIIGTMLVLIFLEPDYGTTFLFGAVGATMMFQAGVNLRWLLPIAVLGVGLFSVAVYFNPERLSRSLPSSAWKPTPATAPTSFGRDFTFGVGG